MNTSSPTPAVQPAKPAAAKKPAAKKEEKKPPFPAPIMNAVRSLESLTKREKEIRDSQKKADKSIGAYFRQRREDLHLKQKTVADGMGEKGLGLTKYNQMELGEGKWTMEDVRNALAFFSDAEKKHAEHVKQISDSASKKPAK